jgi:hypothetical protein
MNVGGGEAADQMVRMMLSGTEVLVRLSGSALKNMLALTMALATNRKTLSGKVNMGKMLRETRDLRRFPMTRQQYKKFQKLAKKHKLLFSVIRDKDDRGKVLDVILPVTELDRANAIFERILYTLPPEQERRPERPLQQGHEVFRERQALERERNAPDRSQADSRPQEDRPEPQEPPRENLSLAERMARQRPQRPPQEFPSKKDSRSEQGSSDTRSNSSTPRKAPVSKMTSDRPSVEDRLKGYRARLDQQKPSAPARDKTKVKPKAKAR